MEYLQPALPVANQTRIVSIKMEVLLKIKHERRLLHPIVLMQLSDY
jgi:hypothetical protein